MKKFSAVFILCTASALLSLPFVPACKKSVNYFDYVSENRKSVYICKEDGYELKVFCTDRETPYSLDGVKGDMTTLTEVYYSCTGSPSKVSVDIGGKGGEMSYMSVTRSFYLSFAGELDKVESVKVNLDIDGKKSEVEIKNTFESGTIDAQSALKCVTEYDGATFERLTSGNSFAGEIGVRLIYDDGCYYYVGVCDREKQLKSYLVDGANGRVIAERETTAE